jgi:hypothetical protein
MTAFITGSGVALMVGSATGLGVALMVGSTIGSVVALIMDSGLIGWQEVSNTIIRALSRIDRIITTS